MTRNAAKPVKKTNQQVPPPELRVAVLVDSSTMWGRGVIRGVHRYSRERGGWHLFVQPRGVEQRRWLPRGWKGHGVIARVGFPELAKRLKSLRLPVVNVSGITLPKVDFPRVASDQDAAAALAARHLLERGFRNFAYFSPVGIEYVAAHQAAFTRTLAAAGCTCDVFEVPPNLGAEPDWNLDIKRLGRWLAGLPKPLAVFAWNTSSAREVLYACAHAGLAVPFEVAVLSGSDDDLFCEITPVPISAVQLDTDQIGYRAAALLDAMIRDPETRRPANIAIPPLGVAVRQSTDTLAVEDESMTKALDFIRSDPARAGNVDEVARYAGLCRRSLEQRFRSVLGCSPASEIRRVKIERAVELLRLSNLTVSAIAARAGFRSAEYMSAVFRKDLGITPSRIRRGEHGHAQDFLTHSHRHS
jgi:LacI family transcriptional regulator